MPKAQPPAEKREVEFIDGNRPKVVIPYEAVKPHVIKKINRALLKGQKGLFGHFGNFSEIAASALILKDLVLNDKQISTWGYIGLGNLAIRRYDDVKRGIKSRKIIGKAVARNLVPFLRNVGSNRRKITHPGLLREEYGNIGSQHVRRFLTPYLMSQQRFAWVSLDKMKKTIELSQTAPLPRPGRLRSIVDLRKFLVQDSLKLPAIARSLP